MKTVIIRKVATNEIRVCEVPNGASLDCQDGYTCSMVYPSKEKALDALERACEVLREALYAEKV